MTVQKLNICILMMQIKEVDLVGKNTSIKTTLLNNRDMESVLISVHDAGTHASACAFTANNK